MASNRTRWDEVDSSTYEDMIAVLISKLHPTSRRVDGSGGDGGRDVHLRLGNGLEIFELKGFTGRLKGARRTQVKRSLGRAAEHHPAAWHLVVPIDPTPAEERWFEELTRSRPFSCDWLGKTWLDAQMAAHRDVPRYFLEGSSDEVIRLLKELQQEQAALTGGVPDAIDRLRTLANRVNEIDPYYGFVLSTGADGSVSVAATPKYVGAEVDRPVRISGAFHFEDDESGRAKAAALADALNFGVPVTLSGEHIAEFTIDAPGMPTEPQQLAQLSLGPPADGTPLPDLPFALRVFEGDVVTAELPLRLVSRTTGARGAELHLEDHSGSVTVALRLDVADRRLNLNYTYSQPDDLLPAALIPPVRFLVALTPDSAMGIAVDGKDAGPPTRVPAPTDDAASGFLSLLSALDRIQRTTGVYFPLPSTLSDEDLHDIDVVERLLDGETVVGSWTDLRITTTVGSLRELAEGPLGDPSGSEIVEESTITFTIGGHEVPLGRSRRVVKARVREWPSVDQSSDPAADVDVVMEPAFDDSVRWQLIRTVDEGGQPD